MTIMKNIVPKKLFKMLKKLGHIAEVREDKVFRLNQSGMAPKVSLKGNNFEDLQQWTRGYQQALEDVSNAIHYDTYPRVAILNKDGEE